MNSCVNCSKSDNLFKIPGRETLFICYNCLNSIKKKDTNWILNEIGLENSICKLCLTNPPSYLDISQSPIKQVCFNCAQQTTKTGSKMFINLKWQAHIKSSNDMNKYYHFKEILKELKQGSQSLIDSLDSAKGKIVTFKQKLIKKLENHFAPSLMKIEDYKAELKACLKHVRTQAKNEIFKGNIVNSANIGAQFITSVYKRRELFDTKPCQVNFFEEKFDEMLENLCRVTFKDTKQLFSDNSLLVFIRKSTSILQVTLETSTFEDMKLESSVKPWKNQASWCNYDNNDILYNGGEIYDSISNEAFILTSDKKVFEVAKCSPKKSHSLCYFDGMMYSIGGTSDITERYDRIANSWEKLTPGPDSFGPVSTCAIAKDNLWNASPGIVVASFKRKDLYFFHVALNKYSKISGPLSNNVSKLLLMVDDSIYCLSKNKVYHSTLEMKNWTVKNSSLPDLNWCSLGTPKIVDSDIYFILDDFSVFVFSTKNFTAKGVKLVKK